MAVFVRSNKNKLALFGGTPINKSKDLKSEPFVSKDELKIVKKLFKEKRFSKFVGSPIDGTYEDLNKPSKDLFRKGSKASFLGGEKVREFEGRWSNLIDSKYSISVNSATSGITTAILSLNLEPGSIILTTPFSFTGTVGAILAANCVPKFSDIDKDTFCLNPENLKKDIENVSCIIPVHWCGNAGNLKEIIEIAKEANIPVIEDAAQAPMTIYENKYLGTFGDIGVFSFNEPKNFMTGEGGIIVTNNENYAVKSRLIRNHGEAILNNENSIEELVNIIGFNFRLTEIQAAIGCEQLKKVKKLNLIRENNYKYLVKGLNEQSSEFLIPQKITHTDSYFAYTAGFRWDAEKSMISRGVLAKALMSEGIPVFTAYGRMLSEHPTFQNKIGFGKEHYPWNLTEKGKNLNYDNSLFPIAEKLIKEEFIGFLCLGYPNGFKEMDYIIEAFKKIMQNLNELRDCNIEDISINIGR
ncbi:MAG: hypothetical protein CMQ53_00965 [Gammaproteobacteria bacterium]|nr:hypothetical protein [Gammaproteobacteria bacterium]|tara:strand:- start:7828 stop:9234 length:1407 start_codon:yes stop_codon:yes gene_type:complete